jgi:hypothetical protein
MSSSLVEKADQIASVCFPPSGAMRSLRTNSKIVAAVLREAGELAAHN